MSEEFKNREELRKRAEEIRIETERGKNTARRVGSLLEDIVTEVNTLESKNKGYFSSEGALTTKYPSPEKGWFAYVPGDKTVEGVTTKTIYIYEVVVDGTGKENVWKKTETETTLDLWQFDDKTEITAFYNISQIHDKYDFEDRIAARHTLPQKYVGRGQVITYKLANGVWVAEQYISDDTVNVESELKKDENWKDLGVQLTSEGGSSEDLAVSQKLFTETVSGLETELNKKVDGYKIVDDDKLQLYAGEVAVGNPIGFGSGSGIINLSYEEGIQFETKQAARTKVETKDRFAGQLITYKTVSDGWVLDHFKGDAVAMWLNDAEWDHYIPSKDITLILNSLENIKGDVTVLNEQLKTKVDGAYTEMIDEETYLYFTVNGEVVGDPVLLPSGGGSGGTGSGVTMKIKSIGSTTIVTGKGSDALIRWNFISYYQDDQSETGEGTINISLNGVTVHSGTVQQGDGSFNLKNYINLGRNTVRLKITDNAGNSRSLTYTVQLADLTLESTFSSAVIYDSTPVPFRYTVRGEGTKTIQFFLNGTELSADTQTASGIQATKEIAVSKEGVNTLLVKASSVIEGAVLYSNELFYEFIYTKAGLTEPVLISAFNRTSVKQFETLQIPYFAYDPFNEKAKVYIYVDDILEASVEAGRTLQVWEYRITQADNVKIELRCGSFRKIFNLSVEKSEIGIEEVLGDLAFRVKALGKSNTSTNKDKWEYGDYKTIFEGFNWTENGWLKDAKGNTALKLTGDAKASINIRPFNTSVLNEGMTYTIEYATEDVADDNVVIMEQFIDGIGIKITPTSISINSVETGITSYLDSSEKVSITFLVEKRSQNRLLEIYINGILSRSIQYSESDRFNQTAADLKISTANRHAVVYVYTIRWYRNSLEDSQILGNYIYDTEDSEKQEYVYKRNNIIDAYGNIDYSSAVNDIPCMTIIGKLPTYKGDKQTNTVIFENRQKTNASFTAEDVSNDVQGTSSQYYPRKNFKFKFNKEKGAVLTDTGIPVKNYALDESALAASVFCVKADFAESSGTHNTGLALLGNDILVSAGIKTPEQEADPKVRTTIYGYPILIFHKETISSEPVFIGKYNFNYDKAAEHVFGFADGCESWEFKDNTSEMCLFRSADFDSTYVNDKNQIVPTWTNSLEARYPDGSENVSKVRKVFEWVISCKDNPVKFKQEAPSVFDIDNLLSYWIITEHYAAVDQRAKNQFLTLYKDGKWRFILYDNDTILGIDNIGTIKFRYDVESQDVIDAGHVWNGWDSELWMLVKEAFWAELVEMYVRLRAGKMTYEESMNIFENHQAAKWAERIYNKDGYFKYIEPLINGHEDEEGRLSNYLAELQGSRTTHRKWWLTNRFKYMDSRFKTGSYIKDFISLRLYTPESYETIVPNADFELVTNKSGYTHIKFGQTESAQVRTVPGVPFTINAPAGMKMNDTETIIYGASSVKDLGNLANKYLGLVDVGSAVRLERLIIGSAVGKYSNLNFKTLTLGNNTMLRELNVANCPNLGNIKELSPSSSLDMSKLLVLETVNASNTALKSVTLPETGTLAALTLPATITSLILRNQTALSSLTLEGKANIQTLVVENTPGVDGYQLAKDIIAENFSNPPLKAVRLIDVDISDLDDSYIMKLAEMDGIDEDGNILEGRPIITGQARFSVITDFAIDYLRAKLPDLEVDYGERADLILFTNKEIEALALEAYDSTKKGYLTSEDVKYKTWTPSLKNLTDYAKFDELRYWTGKGTVISDTSLLTSVGLYTNQDYVNASLKNLTSLETILIEEEKELLGNSPMLTLSTFGNCYNLSNATIYSNNGRYSKSKDVKALLAKKTVSSKLTVDEFVFPFGGNIGASLNIESNNSLPLSITVPDIAPLHSVSKTTLTNIFKAIFSTNKPSGTIEIDGVSRGISPDVFNANIYNAFSMRGSYSDINPNITINAEKEEDAILHYVTLYYRRTFAVGLNRVVINAKCHPEAPKSTFEVNDSPRSNHINTVVFGSQYKPALIKLPTSDGNVDTNAVKTLVIKASEYNGEIYIPTITGKGHASTYYCVNKLYVPDELVDEYKLQYPITSDKLIQEILPLSLSPYQ